MKFIYRPDGTEPQEWPFEPGKLLSPESEAIEKVTGLYLPAWQEAAGEGSQRALRAFLWVMLKRKQPTLKFDQVVVSASEMELVWELDDCEPVLAELHAEQVKRGTLSDEKRATLEFFANVYEDLAGEPWTAPEIDQVEDGDAEPALVAPADVEGEAPKAE